MSAGSGHFYGLAKILRYQRNIQGLWLKEITRQPL